MSPQRLILNFFPTPCRTELRLFFPLVYWAGFFHKTGATSNPSSRAVSGQLKALHIDIRNGRPCNTMTKMVAWVEGARL